MARHLAATTRLLRLTAQLTLAMLTIADVLLGPVLAEGGPPDLVGLSTEEIAANPDAAHLALGIATDWSMPFVPQPVRSLPAEPLQAELSDLRGVLTQLAILAGANNHPFLLQAQSGTDALVVIKGEADLATLAAAHPAILLRDGSGGWRLTRPLVVWQGARLSLGSGDRLAVSTVDGAFLLVFGQLEIDGATLAATSETNPRSADFRPFLLSVGAAELHVSGATVSGFGSPARGLFQGVTHASSDLFPPETPPLIRDSTFQGQGRLSLRRTKNAVIAGNRFFDGAGIDIMGGSDLLLADNLLEDSGQGFALRLSAGVEDSLLLGTTVLGATGAGISVSGLSNHIVLAGTLIDASKGDGLSLDRTSCIRIEGLAVLRGQSVGLRIRSSADVDVSRGAILRNRTSAIAIHGQPFGAPLLLADLTIAGNGVGLKGWGTTAIDLHRVALADQLPRLFEGDLAPFTSRYLASSQQRQEVEFSLRLALPEDGAPAVPVALSSAKTMSPMPEGQRPWGPNCVGG
jgi:mannuronan 5-epimerase